MKKKITIYTLTAAMLLTGCSLKKESFEEQTIFLSKQESISVYGLDLLETHVKEPLTEEEKEEILDYLKELEGDNHILIYEGTTTSNYQDEIFTEALKQNPMIQIYYCGQEEPDDYPNVTYVAPNQTVSDQIDAFYQANRITGYLIKSFRRVKDSIDDFDLEEVLQSIQEEVGNIDKKSIMEGLNGFGEYISNTNVFQKCEEVGNKASEALKPYVQAAIPKVENAWNEVKPYLEKGKEKANEFYQEVRPEMEEAYDKAKDYVKNWFVK